MRLRPYTYTAFSISKNFCQGEHFQKLHFYIYMLAKKMNICLVTSNVFSIISSLLWDFFKTRVISPPAALAHSQKHLRLFVPFKKKYLCSCRCSLSCFLRHGFLASNVHQPAKGRHISSVLIICSFWCGGRGGTIHKLVMIINIDILTRLL